MINIYIGQQIRIKLEVDGDTRKGAFAISFLSDRNLEGVTEAKQPHVCQTTYPWAKKNM